MLGSLAIADIIADLTYFALNSVVYSVKLLNHTAVWAWLPKISRALLLSTPLQHILDTRLAGIETKDYYGMKSTKVAYFG